MFTTQTSEFRPLTHENIEWNATKGDYPPNMLLYRLFERQAAETPEATAIVYEDQTLSCRQLGQAADALAWRLQAADVGRRRTRNASFPISPRTSTTFPPTIFHTILLLPDHTQKANH